MPKKLATQTDLTFLLQELVQMPTVSSNHAANHQALQWFKWQLGGLPLHITDFEQNGVPSLIITTRKTKRPHILFLGHMDVVPGPKQLFKPLVKDGRMYGRGASDMKFAIACFLKLLLELGPDLPEYDLGVTITGDEEAGGKNGALALTEHGYSADYAIIPDGAPNWGIESEAKGYVELLVESTGVAAHASRPWEGDNAIDSLFAFILELKHHFILEPCGDKNHFHDTINTGVISAGQISTVIPDYAKAVLNVRLATPESSKKFSEWLDEVVSEHPKIKVTTLLSNAPIKHAVGHEYTKLYQGLLRERGIESSFVRAHGATDARYLPQDVAVLVSKPISGPQHSDDEWIDLASVEQYYDVLRAFTERAARK